MELGGKWGVAFVHCLDVVKEHGKGDSVVEGMVKNDDKVIFLGGRVYMTKINRGPVKCILGVKVEATNEILCRAIDGLPLLAGPFEVERGMYDLSPATDFNREVE